MRHAGRGGVGAVMGSKGLKAIIINPEGGKNHVALDMITGRIQRHLEDICNTKA